MDSTTRALVLGGGGVAGISWETGVLVGLADAGVDVRNADLIVGTSAGANVAAQISSGLSWDELFMRQVEPARQAAEIARQLDPQKMAADFGSAYQGASDASEVRRRVGGLALRAETPSVAERRAVIVSRLPEHTWPEQRIGIVAVDVHSGERRVFERGDGVDLVDAVSASSAVPGIWPTVRIGGLHYTDGGVYTMENADLASGFDRVLVLALEASDFAPDTLTPQARQLREEGAQVEIVRTDAAYQQALATVGGNLLDPAARALAAQAGREQGRRIAASLAAFWG